MAKPRVQSALGWFLMGRGTITPAQHLAALDEQMRRRPPIGRLAVETRMLSVDQVLEILERQSAATCPFGRIAVDLGSLSEGEVERLLQLQSESAPSLESLLVDLGFCGSDDLAEEVHALTALVTSGKRESPRFKVAVPVEFHTAHVWGTGTVWDLSATGARIEHVSEPIEPGTRVAVRGSFFPGAFDVELQGEVVRTTSEEGFAIRFVDLGPAQIDLLRRALPRGAAPCLEEREVAS